MASLLAVEPLKFCLSTLWLCDQRSVVSFWEELNFVMIVLVGLQWNLSSLIPKLTWSGLRMRLSILGWYTTVSKASLMPWAHPFTRGKGSRNTNPDLGLASETWSDQWNCVAVFMVARLKTSIVPLMDSFFNTDQFVILHLQLWGFKLPAGLCLKTLSSWPFPLEGVGFEHVTTTKVWDAWLLTFDLWPF